MQGLNQHHFPEEKRGISVKTGISVSSQGSATVKIGKTEVLVNISGPKELRFRNTDTGLTQISVQTYPRIDLLNTYIENAVRNTLDLKAYPDSVLDVSVTSICNDGSLFSCATNAVLFAIKDAGYKTVRKINSVTIAYNNETNELKPYPFDREEKNAAGVANFVYDRENGQVITSSFVGTCPVELFIASLSRCAEIDELWQEYY